jgi:hypothetical protein
MKETIKNTINTSSHITKTHIHTQLSGYSYIIIFKFLLIGVLTTPLAEMNVRLII